MKYSYNWLKELSGTKLSPEKMADLLMMHSFELEEILTAETGLERVVVGEIKAIKKHPNADRLQLTKVNIGKQTLDIVCGAMNIANGQKVPVALDGAKLLSGIVIKETEIRGVKSKGMLCSEKDMGIGEDHEGIMILPSKAKVGEGLGTYIGSNDFQIQLDVLANRGHDALSHVGMAREICALENKKLKYNFGNFAKKNSKEAKFGIKIKDPKLCRRYIGTLIEGIDVTPSPEWIQTRLKVCGVRPINNIVDITNYVMLETGQPLHAFDSKKTTGNIIVRRAKNGEVVKLLDEKEYRLNENNLVIADSKKALALAGVMGGFESSISSDTSSIILESANFDPVNIRKTRVGCGLNTESSYRFERDIDPNLAEIAMARAIDLIKKFCGKNIKIASTADMYPNKINPWKIRLELAYADKLLGEKVSLIRIKTILENLGMSVKSGTKYFDVEIPTIRLDLKTQEDLIEEIGRIYGYENIFAKAPCIELQTPMRNEQRILEDKLRDILIGSGFSEMMNYSFYSQSDIEKCGLDAKNHFEVANPMNPDQQYMRTSLIPGILKNIELNLKNFEKFSIFEIGRIYLDPNAKIPDERAILSGALVDLENKKNIFFELKGKMEALLDCLGIESADFVEPKLAGTIFHPSRTVVIKANGKIIGCLGEINPQVSSEYKIKTRVAAFELNIADILSLSSLQKEYKSISKFPSVKRDVSMYIDEKTKYADIKSKIYNAGGKLVLGVELFDIFEKEGEKSMALRVEIGSREKTLTSEEIDGVTKKIIEKLEKDLKVKVRK
ncbi:MAG: phenylalanine--tRNA ligase subunit beta [Parcubacteria group bacterium]|jgi:phenylalanyl-tRNA synthetase beta chain